MFKGFKRFYILALPIVAFYAYASCAHAKIEWPVDGRTSIEVGATSNAFIGNVESMFPIYGHLEKKIGLFDITGAFDNRSAFLLSPGVGVRDIINNRIYGVYLFGDLTRTSFHNTFFVFNPGLEWMSTRWDFHINGYFPTSKTKKIAEYGLASSNGNYNFITFQGHTAFDQVIGKYDVVGNGFDAEIGYLLGLNNLRSRAHVGGYYFNPEDNASSIEGVQVGFEYPIKHNINIEFSGSYDNVFKTKAALTLIFNFGNVADQVSSNVKTRMMDKIPRHLGTLQTAASIPSQSTIQATSSQNIPIANNIWFFQPNGEITDSVAFANCTVESPCGIITQSYIDSINSLDPNAMFYFAPGNYVASNQSLVKMLSIYPGQSFWGRTAGFTQAASGNQRPTIDGLIELLGNNRLDSLQLVNNDVAIGNDIVGIHTLGTSTGQIILNNINVDTEDSVNRSAINLLADGDSNILISNNTWSATEFNLSADLNGSINAYIRGNSNVTVDNSSFTSTDYSFIGSFNFYTQDGASSITLNNSELNAIGNNLGGAVNIFTNDPTTVTANNITMTAIALGDTTYGASNVITGNNGVTYVNNSNLTSINNRNSTSSVAASINNFLGTTVINGSIINSLDKAGINASGIVNQQGLVILNNSTLNVQELGVSPLNPNGSAIGVQGRPSSDSKITNSIINVTANSNATQTSGIFLDGATATIEGATLNIQQQGTGFASGIDAGTNSTATLNQSTVIVNGALAGPVHGVHAAVNSSIMVDSTNFNITTLAGTAIGAEADASSAITISSSNFVILSQGPQAFGVVNESSNMTIINSNFTITGDPLNSLFSGGSIFPLVVGGSCSLNGGNC